MKVRYSYLEEQFANPDDILNDIKRLLKTTQFTLGPEVEEFESKFAKLCGTQYAIGVGSGTDALLLSLKALDIGPGDEVITAPNTFIATVGAIATSGAKPVFVDVNQEYNINPTLIETAITDKTKAIIPVHYTGNPAKIPEIMEIAKRYNLPLVEDACQAISAAIDGQPVGSFGITGCFSLHPLKNLNVWGDGGIITTNSVEMDHKLRLMRNHGLENRDEVELFGYNSRLDTLQAIVGNHLIDEVAAITEARIRNAKMYDEAFSLLAPYITIPPRDKSVRHVYHIYMFQAKDRDELYKYLLNNEIDAKIHYPIPLHLQRASKNLGYKKGDFPVCETQCKSIISLPAHQYLKKEQIEYVIDKIKSFYKGATR
ncbi:MAG: DegT/DnrJ/EryC1/StrS family aminotransferase [bacterium]|nr:DegT/DnrJ/EryC1/StrS family aminotransferase [bacterium]